MEPGKRTWAFANAVLDERTFELKVDGVPVKLEKKYFEVLTLLLRRAGELVKREEILDAVWPGRIVTEAVLNKCIWKLRDVLGDRDQAVIRTVHGVGFRLVAPVSPAADGTPAPGAAADAPARGRYAILAHARPSAAVALVAAVAVGIAFHALRQVRQVDAEHQLLLASGVAENAVAPVAANATIEQRLRRHLAVGRQTLVECPKYGCSEAGAASVKRTLARVHARLGEHREAVSFYDESLGTRHWTASERLDQQVLRAMSLLRQQRYADARAAIQGFDASQVAQLPPGAPTLGRLRHLEGLLALHDKEFGKARGRLDEALEILSRAYSTHLEAESVRHDLAGIPRGPES